MLKATVAPGHRVTEADFARSVFIMRERLRRLGIRATVTHPRNSLTVVVNLPDAKPADRLPSAAWSPGVLEVYDLEADLARPSIDAQGIPVASTKLLTPRPRTVLIRCGSSEVVCPGQSAGGVVNPPPAGSTYYYLFKHDPTKSIPEMTGNDLNLSGTRQDFDASTNEPTVLIRFTQAGRKHFRKLTREEWLRGKQRNSPQHFAIVLDGEIKSFPQIDYTDSSLSGGIDPVSGAQITGLRSVREAKELAVVFQTRPLPVRFVRIP